MIGLGTALGGIGCGDLGPPPPIGSPPPNREDQSTPNEASPKEKETSPKENQPSHIDEEWFRHSLVEDNLRHWLRAAPLPNGFFRPNLDREWRPANDQTATLVSQSRLLFVFATGYEVTKDAAYLDALQSGGRFLLKYFRDFTHGGWFWSVAPDGSVLDSSKDSYGHAFAIFGLSHAFRVSRDTQFGTAAMETWDVLKSKMFDSQGGLRSKANTDFTRTTGGNSQNPIMHLFEALLALHDATKSPVVFEDARKLVEFVVTRLYRKDEGCIPEAFGPEWKPVAPPAKEWVEMGHQPEWAFLLSRAVEKGFPERFMTIGNQLLDYSMKKGYDPQDGGLTEGPGNAGKGLWQQCEFLRALMRYASQHGRDDLWQAFDQSLALVKRDFIDTEFGGWYQRPSSDKGNVWKVGYHETGMYLEAMRIGGSSSIK